MGHKPWDWPWKRAEKAREKRRWKREVGADVPGTYLLPDVNAPPDVLPPSAAIIPPDHGTREITEADRKRAIVIELMNSETVVHFTPGMRRALRELR